MNDGNQPSGSGGSGAQQQQSSSSSGSGPSQPYQRVRRTSASIISSTTPMFQAPQNPNHHHQQPHPPHQSPMQHSRQRQNNVIQQNNNFGPGDIDDDVQQPQASSSFSYSSSLRGRLSAGGSGSSAASSSSSNNNNFNNNRPQSPLGSPDSTAYWGPSPSPAAVPSYRAPLTPGGVCAVSSSTSDDIPQSPFSPEDLGGNSNHGFPLPAPMPPLQQQQQQPPSPAPEIVNIRNPPPPMAVEASNNDFNLVSQLHRRRPSLATSSPNVNRSVSSSSLPSSSSSSSSSLRGSSSNRINSLNLVGNQFQHENQNRPSQDLNQNPSGSGSGVTAAGSSSSSHLHNPTPATQQQQSFNISPLRNKIKKASSFERFSLAQAAITLNSTTTNSSSSGNNSNNASSSSATNSQSQNVGGESSSLSTSSSSISSLPPTTTTTSGSIITTNSSGSTGTNHYTSNSVNGAATSSGSGGPSSSRAMWDPSPPPPPSSEIIITPSTSASGLRAFNNSHHGLSEKFHIKIPSKKLAAKIASVYEQEKLNEQLLNNNNANISSNNSATLAAAEAISVIGSALINSNNNNNKRSGLSSVIASVAGSNNNSGINMGGSSSSSTISSQNNDGLMHSSSSLLPGQNNNNNSQLNTPSTLAQILNQSSNNNNNNNIHVSNIMTTTTTTTTTEESIMNQEVNHENLIREFGGEAPLNLTETGTNSGTNSGLFPPTIRNPVISSRILSSTSKKIPLTPKQKLLHRLQSGELLVASLSPPPPPSSSQPIVSLSQQLSQQQQQQSLPIQTIQQQQNSISSIPVVTLHQTLASSLSPDHNNLQAISTIGNSSQHSPPSQQQQQQQQILDQYSYDQLLRARDDFIVQDSLGKVVGGVEDPNMLSVYDPADYSYYSYQNILGDEIFTGGNPSSSASGTSATTRQLLMMPPDSMDQQPHPGTLEFLGFSGQGGDDQGGIDNRSRDNSNDENDDDDLQLNNIDPNDLSASMKSSHMNQTSDSTLRNLLMMDTLRNSGSHNNVDDNAWLTLAAEYQNRIINGGGGGMRISGGSGGSNLILGLGSNTTSSSISGGGNASVVNMSNNSSMSNAWVNDWPRTSSWPPHSNISINSGGLGGVGVGGGVQDQDEVMDMSSSMIDQHVNVKGPLIPMSNQLKRLQMQMQSANNSTGNDHQQHHHQHHVIDEMDLTTGLPILSVNMPIDLQQQPMSILPHGVGKDNGSLPMDLQQHNHQQHHHHHQRIMDMDDEPVNLMAVNMDQDSQDLVVGHHHHQQHSMGHSSSSSLHLNQSHLSSHSQQQQQQQQNNSYSLQIQSSHQQHSPSDLQQGNIIAGDMGGMGGSSGNINNLQSSCPDSIDERRIIRAKKNNIKQQETLIMTNNLDEDGYQLTDEEQEHVNVIMDKPVQPKSIASLPSPFRLSRISGNELAVFNNTHKNIPANCRLGPVEGPLRKASDDIANMNAAYPSLVMADGNTDLWQLDRGDDDFCNWMKFVRLAHSIKDQNALVVESDGYLYFMTCKDISPNTEVQVGYSYEYAQKYGLPYLLPMDAFLDQDNRIMKDNNNSMMVDSLKPSSYDVGSGSGKNHPSSSPHSPQPHPQQQLHLMHDDDDDKETGVEEQILDQACEQQQEPNNKMITVEIYQCFECDEEFSQVEQLQAHLNTHKDVETIRKPKKKAIKKFHTLELDENNSLKNLPTTSTASISMPPPAVGKVQSQTMNADSSTVMAESSHEQVLNRIVIQHQRAPGEDSAPTPTVVIVGKQQDNSVTTGTGQPIPPPKVKCSMCYKSFLTKERLEKHMIVHSDEDTKPLKCNFCTKRFLTNSALAGHTKTHAEEGKFFECPMCKFSTPQLLSLKEHVQTHKSRDTGLFYCPKCPKKFSVYSMIRKHIRAFHGPRQFRCEECDSSFPTSDKLKLHQLKHSDHREFLCALCGRQFKRKDKLREHTKRIHETKKKIIEIIPKDSKNSKNSKFIPRVPAAEYERFPFKCSDCMVGFKRRGMLVNHLAKRHPEKTIKSIPELNLPILRLTRNYPCLYCERIYKSSSKRKSHILKAHPGRPIPPQLRGTGSANNSNVAAGTAIIASELTSGGLVVNNNNDIIRPPTIGTVVQTVTEDGDPRSGIMNVSCTNNAENNLVSTTSTSQSTSRKEASVIGKVAALPHPCQWCYRQYATRAKLLQHQRKAHISLMPADMQTPRTQKNNVSKAKKDKGPNSEATASNKVQQPPRPNNMTSSTEGTTTTLVMQDAKTNMLMESSSSSALIIPDSTSATASTNTNTTSTIQTIATVTGDGLNEGNVIGYLLTTSAVSPSDIGNLIQPELVMLGPVSSLGVVNNCGSGGTNAILTPQQSLTLRESGNCPNQNITIIASSSSGNNISKT